MTLSKLFKSRIGAFLVIIPFIKPSAEITGSYDVIFDVWKLVMAILVFICFFCSKRKLSLPLISVCSIQIIYFISTVVHFGELSAAIVQMVSNISLCLYVDYMFEEEEYIAVRNLCYPTVTMAILTALTMFIYYPHGMYQIKYLNYTESSNYLWGFDNTSGLLFIPTIFFLIIYSLYVNKKKTYFKTLLLLALFVVAFFYVDSKTAYLMMFLILLGFIFTIYNKWKFKIINPKLIPMLIILGFIAVFLFNENISILWNFVSKEGKYYSVKARFIFWQRIVGCFTKSPIIGYGLENELSISSKIGIDHPHNYFMDLLYRGGIIAFLFMICFLAFIVRNKIIKDSISIMTGFCLLAILILVMLDYYNNVYLFYPQLYLSYLLLKRRKYVLPLQEVKSKYVLMKRTQ